MIYKYIFTIVSFVSIIGTFSYAQVKLVRPIEIDTPQELNEIFGDKIVKTSSIDFNGDMKDDFVAIIKTGLLDEPLTREYWYDSDFVIFKKVDLNIKDYDFKFFVNIDKDPEPEILRANGYSDGIDYYFTDQNLNTKSESILFYFNPLIKKVSKNNSDYFWGYPWTLQSVFLKPYMEGVKLNCSIHHHIIRDSEITYPENQLVFPVILFDGNPKSTFDYENKIDSTQWLTVSEIIQEISIDATK